MCDFGVCCNFLGNQGPLRSTAQMKRATKSMAGKIHSEGPAPDGWMTEDGSVGPGGPDLATGGLFV